MKHREVSSLWKNTQLIHNGFGNETKEIWFQTVSKSEKGNMIVMTYNVHNPIIIM